MKSEKYERACPFDNRLQLNIILSSLSPHYMDGSIHDGWMEIIFIGANANGHAVTRWPENNITTPQIMIRTYKIFKSNSLAT